MKSGRKISTSIAVYRNTLKEKPHGKKQLFWRQDVPAAHGHHEAAGNRRKRFKEKIDTLNQRIDILKKENLVLKEEDQLLIEDNARLKTIINNDIPTPPSHLLQNRKAERTSGKYPYKIQSGRKNHIR